MAFKSRDVFIPKNKIGLLEESQLKRFIIHLNHVIDQYDTMEAFCKANEVFDLNIYKKYTKPHLIQRTIIDKGNKPYVFVINKN